MDTGVTALVSALMKGGCPKLTGLYLGRNEIGDRGASAIADMLRAPVAKCAPNLKQLHLFRNKITSVGRAAVEATASMSHRAEPPHPLLVDLGDAPLEVS